ncbi:transglycosylase domain-containing protein [Candidatus Saccharibacteria bacterium]|nr:transglycosylase domain-containing protein [Candidatus Saccharibacteria bacterium]
MNKKKSNVILPSKSNKTAKSSKKTAKKKMTLYSSLSYKHKVKKEAESRRRAEELAKLPKDPVKRFFARLHPKRVFKWWFSKRGQKTIWKTIAACVLLFIIFIGGLFLYYKKDLDEIKLDEMSIAETVNTYLDRNGTVLWKDTGSENYRLVVDAADISPYMYQATVAIEDRNFYDHIGVDFGALVRATLSTLSGHGVQGGSTLTQQLIKQVYFADEAASENRGGLNRKIKELILAIELERMYSKDQILTMYLNQSPYGGRRNGVESAAQTYFGKSAKDLTLAESALLASVPNNPGLYNPYNEYGHEYLLQRQQYTLDIMAEMGYITKEEAEEAKQVAILDTIQPEAAQYADILAPHFVLEVKSMLEEKYGIQTMRSGGWTITTTLDYRAQQVAEAAVAAGADISYINRSDNIALASLDVDTSQVIAMVGSVDFNNPEYGSYNAANALLEPGSTIKPVLDYTPLLMEREGINYGPGSILKDENIDSIYCAGSISGCQLRNYTGRFYGNVTIRQALSNSLNIPAVKALYINGIDNSLEVLHALGDKSYCEDRDNYGLSIAIGSGCNVRLLEHANAYASISRGGSYKDIAYVLELRNSSGEVLEKWEDTEGERVVDEQVAYMMWDILHDPVARASLVWGSQSYAYGFVVPGVETASKTGTTTTSNSSETKDSLMISFSSAISTVVWNGNHDGSGLSNSDNSVVRRVVNNYMEGVHKDVYAADGKWASGDMPNKPAGIQTLTVNGKTDIWPSWYNSSKNSGVTKETLVFNRYNHLLASSCTPEDHKIEVEVTKTTDPMTGNEVYNVPEPYDRNTSDTCDYTPPQLALSTSGNKIIATVKRGTSDISSYTLYVNGVEQSGISLGSDGTISGYTLKGTETSIKFTVTDSAGYTVTGEMTLTPTKQSDSQSTKPSTDDNTKSKSSTP